MAKIHMIVGSMLPLGLLACGDGTDSNFVSRELKPLASSIAASDDALTFAQTKTASGQTATLLISSLGQNSVQGVDLTLLGAPLDTDMFDAMSALSAASLQKAVSEKELRRSYPIASLVSPAGKGTRHVATGTNFREHAKEAGINTVFNFPKFGQATPARTSVALKPGALLDYEVEICARFDRDIKSVADFDAARKGFFLCGDFTDRARLLQLINFNNIESGEGFSDAKSGSDFFPTGPFLVVPRDWKAFVKAERMTTRVNKNNRQDARGKEMILDFRAIVNKALINGGGGSYKFKGSPIPLLQGAVIKRGSAVMSGTSEGVVFMPPKARDYVTGVARYIFTGPMIRGESAQRTLITAFIQKERRLGRYLKAGDVVQHNSSSMGDVTILVKPTSVLTSVRNL